MILNHIDEKDKSSNSGILIWMRELLMKFIKMEPLLMLSGLQV